MRRSLKRNGVTSSASSESIVFSVFPLVRESDYTNEVNIMRQSSYIGGGIGMGSVNPKSSSILVPGRNYEIVVEDFTLKDQVKHVTI